MNPRVAMVAGILVLWAGSARAGFQIELDGGDRMVVDTYWEEGDQVHLVRDGMDLTVPKARVRQVRAVDDPPAPLVRPRRHATRSLEPAAPPSRDELEAKQAAVEKHLLRVQQERFEADARGEPPDTMKKLDGDFRRAQERRRDLMRKIEQLDGSK
jgi:hypothetical protein